MHVLYDLDELTQIPGRRMIRELGGGQIEIYMGDAWEHADDPVYPEPMTALAYRFGINYVIYAMTH